MNAYCVAFPKKEIILGADLQWKSFSDLKPGSGIPDLFFAESSVSLRVGQWFSLNGITASAYACRTIGSVIEKKIGTQPVMKGETITEENLRLLIKDKVYPKEFIRGPLSRNDKIHLMDIISESVAGNGPLRKNDMKDQYDESNIVLIFDTKNIRPKKQEEKESGKAKDIQEDPNLVKTLLTVCGSVEDAQEIASWFRKPGLHLSPLKKKTAAERLGCSLDGLEINSFDRLIQKGVIPEKLGRKPYDKAEIQEFQKSLSESPIKPESPEKDVSDPEYSQNMDGETASEMESAQEGGYGEEAACSIIAPSPVTSKLVKEMVAAAKDFKNLLDVSADLLYKKSKELKQIEQYATDLYHIVEFCDLNAADGYRLYKTQQQNLRKRRLLKDEIFALDQIAAKLRRGVTAENLDEFIKSVEGMSTRQYHLRGCSMEDVHNLIHSQKILDAICPANQSVS